VTACTQSKGEKNENGVFRPIFHTVVYIMNDREAVLLASGILFVQLLVKVLKKILRQPRPTSTLQTYGMPSSRAAIVFFIIVYMMLKVNNIERITVIILLIVGVASCASKYLMREHTMEQLVAGSIVGTSVAFGMNHLFH
jgi:membrane-associated phospholipid phosphatase